MTVPGRKYRVRYRLWRNSLRLRHEQDHYRQKFQQLGLSLPNDNSLKSEFKTMFHHLQAKPKGLLNIIAVYHHYNWENYSLKPALEKFGTVRLYDWFDEFNHNDRKWRQSGKFQMNKALVDDDAEMFIDAFVNLQWHERSVEVGSQRMMHELDFTESDLQINPLMKYIDLIGR